MNANVYIDILINKVKSLLRINKTCLSAMVINSDVEDTAAIRQNVRFYNSSLGRYSYVGRETLVQNTKIGAFCSVSESCNIGMPSHPVTMVSTSPVFLKGNNVLKKNFAEFEHTACKNTEIGSDVWLGAAVSVKSGLKIGHGAIVGTGAVVTHDIPPYEIWGGNPARCIKKRFDDETIERLLKSEWWTLSDNELITYREYFNDPIRFLQYVEEK